MTLYLCDEHFADTATGKCDYCSALEKYDAAKGLLQRRGHEVEELKAENGLLTKKNQTLVATQKKVVDLMRMKMHLKRLADEADTVKNYVAAALDEIEEAENARD